MISKYSVLYFVKKRYLGKVQKCQLVVSLLVKYTKETLLKHIASGEPARESAINLSLKTV